MYTLPSSYEIHDAHDDYFDFDYEDAQRKSWLEKLKKNKPAQDKGPMLLVTFQSTDGEQSRLAVSKTQGYMQFQSYVQISKDSDLGNYLLAHKDEIKPGFVWERSGAIAISIDREFCPEDEEAILY